MRLFANVIHRPASIIAAMSAATYALGWIGPANAQEKPLDPAEVEAWLESRSLPASSDAEPTPEAPPPPPHHHGFVIEANVGAMNHLGDMGHVTPTSPWFRAQLGWEPVRWAMLFAAGDIAFGSTSYANPPPEPRGFALWGIGVGGRFTVEPADWLGVFGQLEIGMGEVTENVLSTYGFEDADSINPYYGALLGLEWYQVNPHYAIVLSGGVRNYQELLDRQRSSETSLAWLAALGLNYTF